MQKEKLKEHLLCNIKLKKALYRPKQATRACYSKIEEHFKENGIRKSPSDPNLYINIKGDDDIAIVVLYVDDIIIIGNCTEMIEELKDVAQSL
jgi:hypothetical protein